MALKIPGIGKLIRKFGYAVTIDNTGECIITIIRYFDNRRNGSVEKYLFIELKTDERYKKSDYIREVLLDLFSSGNNDEIVRIREDTDRIYIWVNEKQFTGKIIGRLDR